MIVTAGNIDEDGAQKERDENGRVKKQEVYVLDGGFVEWQEKYAHVKFSSRILACILIFIGTATMSG